MPWYVECDDYRFPTAYRTETEAETKRRQLDEDRSCPLPHRVVEIHHRGPRKEAK